MGQLIAAAVLWMGIHLLLAGTRLRHPVAARLGEGGFRAVFSVLSVASITWLVLAYNATPTTPLWYAPPWLRWVLAAIMLVVFVLFVASLSKPNPTAVGGERLAGQPAQGIQRITRHPMLWAFALWAAVHVLGNGDTASTVFFGAFLVTALAGMPSLDAKLARRNPAGWAPLAASSSVLPFGAVLAGRNRVVWREVGLVPPILGLLLWAALLHLHPRLFGVSPLG